MEEHPGYALHSVSLAWRDRHPGRIAFLIALLVSAAIQLYATVSDRNLWPVASFDVFSGASGQQVWLLKVVLGNDRGEQEAVDPGRVLPIEFFKARSIVGRVFLGPTPGAAKAAFARRILIRLSSERWRGLDEVLPPAAISDPTHFQVELWRVDPAVLDNDTGFLLRERLLAYRMPDRGFP